MAHRTTQRRILAGSDSKKPPFSTMEPTQRKPTKNPDPTIPIPSKPSSNLYSTGYLSKSLDSPLTHKFRTTQQPISHKNPTHRPKPMLVSPKSRDDDEGRDKTQQKVVSFKGFGDQHKKKNNLGGGQRSWASSLPLVASSGGGGGGRRRSLGGPHVELADVLASNGVKVVSVDMPPFMQIHAVELARKVHDSLEKFTSKTLASTLKKEFDGIYGPAWHCIVGTSFGSFVTHSVGGFLYFSMDQKLYILLFKTTVQRVDS